MTTKELSIGNWVTDNNHMPMFVQAIYDKDTVYLDAEWNEADTWETDIEDIRPIEITEEFLLKNDFNNRWSKDIYSHKVDKWSVSLSPMSDDSYNLRFYFPGETITDIKVRYVHELQNAVMLITKKELEVKI